MRAGNTLAITRRSFTDMPVATAWTIRPHEVALKARSFSFGTRDDRPRIWQELVATPLPPHSIALYGAESHYASGGVLTKIVTIPLSTGFTSSVVGSVPKRSLPIPLISCNPTPCMYP